MPALARSAFPLVDFGARGIDVEAAWQDGQRLTVTGDRFAAPHLTGLVTRICSKHPGVTLVRREPPEPRTCGSNENRR